MPLREFKDVYQRFRHDDVANAKCPHRVAFEKVPR